MNKTKLIRFATAAKKPRRTWEEAVDYINNNYVMDFKSGVHLYQWWYRYSRNNELNDDEKFIKVIRRKAYLDTRAFDRQFKHYRR